MSIRSNIEEVIAQVKTPGGSAIGDDIQRTCVAANKGGITSGAWKTYMRRFAKTEEQLARLCAEDNTADDFLMDVSRVYLVSNGCCGSLTVDRLAYGVEDRLDQGLPPIENQTPLA